MAVPLSEKVVAQGYNKSALDYYEYFLPEESHHVELLKELINLLPRKARILDAGCGGGVPAGKFLVSKGYDVTGIDISTVMLALAKKNIPKGKFKRMSMYDMKFKPASFDAVVSFFAILHLERRKVPRVLAEISKLLVPGGLFLFSVNRGSGEEAYGRFFHAKTFFSSYTKAEIRKMLRTARFKIILNKDFYFERDGNGEEQMFFLARRK